MNPKASNTLIDGALAKAKATLRAEMLDRRKTLSRVESNAAAGLKRCISSVFGDRTDRLVAGYVALGDELNPSDALGALHAQGVPLALPVAEKQVSAMIFRQWSPDDALVPGPFGTVCPPDTAEIVQPDIVLVPLVAFDRSGYRLGFGRGYYDRTLSALRQCKYIVSYGIAFDGQEVDVVPRSDWDERLDGIITPTRLVSSMEQR